MVPVDFPQCRVVTNPQFVKSGIFVKCNKMKCNKTRYTCTIHTHTHAPERDRERERERGTLRDWLT